MELTVYQESVVVEEIKEVELRSCRAQEIKVSHFYFYFCPKLGFRMYFVYFHTFSYKFKVQRAPREFGLHVIKRASTESDVSNSDQTHLMKEVARLH